MSTDFFLCSRRLDAVPAVRPYIRLEEKDRALLVEGHWRGTVSACVDEFQEIESLPDELADIKTVVTLREAIITYDSYVNVLRTGERPVYPRYREPDCDCKSDLDGDLDEQSDLPCLCERPPLEAEEKKLGAVETHLLVQGLHSTEWSDRLEDMRAIHSAFARILDISAPGSRHLEPANVSAVIEMLCRDNVLSSFRSVINDIALHDRRLFTTSEGYLGCGSKGIKTGDRLALVAGIPAPLVLRPVDIYPTDWFETEYVVTCSAFVLGWMDGSAFEVERAREIRLI
jgi:hypothetical protein